MTDEELIMIKAEEKCDKLCICQLVCESVSLILILLYMYFNNIYFMIFSILGFALYVIEETAIIIINRRAIKHVNRRIKRLNISLNVIVRRFPQDKLRLESSRYEREYDFLKK